MLVLVLPVHNKINHIQTFTVGLAIGTKTVGRLGFVIYLHAGGLVIVEGATDPVMLVGFQAIVRQHGGHG